jgi:hypothetical protein
MIFCCVEFAVQDQKGDQLYLGITHQGIMTFRGSRRTQLYKWSVTPLGFLTLHYFPCFLGMVQC